MSGNIKDAEKAAQIHALECHAIPGQSRYKQPAPYNRPSASKHFLGAGSYRCAYRIRGYVYKVEHQWWNRGNCNATELENSRIARKYGIRIIPPVTQYMVRVRNYRGRLTTVSVNVMPFYPKAATEYPGYSYYSAADRALDGTVLEHLTWDMGSSNLRCTKGGALRLIDAASQC